MWIILLNILIFFLVIVLIVVFARKLRTLDNEGMKRAFKFYGILILIVILFILLYFHVIEIKINATTEADNLLWTLILALTFGMMINAIGLFNKGMKKQTYKIIVMVILILVYVIINTAFDITIYLNFLPYPALALGSEEGVWFVWYNLWIFEIVFLLSFTTESEEV